MLLNEPLGVPQGSVRAALVLILVVAFLLFIYLGRDTNAIIGLVSAAFGYYFGSRETETKTQPRSESEPLLPTASMGEEIENGIDVIPGE